MSKYQLPAMWCLIVCIIVILLYRPHQDFVKPPQDGEGLTPARVDYVQGYLGLELFVVGLLIAGGAVTIHVRAKHVTDLNKV